MLDTDLRIAERVLRDKGGVKIRPDQRQSWSVVNQFTKAASTADLPAIFVGEDLVTPNPGFDKPCPLVDEVSGLTGHTCTLFAIYSLFLDDAGKKELRARYLAPGLKYGEVKKELAEVIWHYFAPYRQRREDLAHDPEGVRKIMKRGAEKARSVAATYLQAARHATGIDY